MQIRLRVAPQRRREGFRRQIARLLAAVLVGTLLVPVAQMTVPALREQASAITTGALLNLDASNASSYSGSGVNWYDLSGNSRHATLVNSPTYDATNKAIVWGADNTSKHATVSNFYSGNWDNGFSVSFYADMGTAKSYARVFDFSPAADTNGSPNNINVHREGTTQNLRVTFTGSSKSYEGACKSGSIIDNSAFAHYAITITTSGACTFYKNGTSNSTSQMNTGANIPTKPTAVARGSAYIARAHWNDPYSDGKLRNLAIYNSVLTGDQVTANYNAQSGVAVAQSALTLSSTAGTYGTPLRLTTTGGSGTGAVTYTTSTSGCNITNTDSLTVTSALTCSVTATKAASSGYSAISSSATNVVFATRPITIKAAAKSATYTGSRVSVSNSYSITSGTLAGSDSFTALTYTYSSGSYSASQLAPINTGSYTITPSAASFSVGSASNYRITYETGALTIGVAAQSALTLNLTSGTYGTTLRLTTTGGSGTGGVTYSTGTSGCSITNTDSLTVNSVLTCSVTATKAADSNYTVISSSATNVVFATRPITIKAAAKSATYTGSSVSVSNSYSITSGTLVGSETFTALTYTYSSGSYSASQTAPIIAGSYTITPSAASFSVGSASNYNITYETATLTINKANQSALTITTTTGTYGTPLRLVSSGGTGTGALSFAITSAGTASGCSITNETITVSSIGTCNVTASKAADTNYLIISSIETIITFAKADTITVTTTLSSSSVTYNELPANVTVTQTVTGLVGTDTATVASTYALYACESGGSCAVGDLAPGGGYVFYVSATPINVATGISTGGIYLATAPQTWYGGAADPTASWGCSGTDISGTSAAVGAGAQNTWLNTVGCATAGRASRLAADSSAEGFTDWFMPSSGELNLIYSNLKLSNLSNLNGTDYWSSTQDVTNPAYSATYRWFGGSSSGPTDKNNTLSVRLIRAFSPTVVAGNTMPTEVGTYQVSSALTLSSPASLSNYQGVESVTATLTINMARQKTISIGQYQAYPNMSSYPLNVYGGSGPGILTRTLVSAGTAGCSLTGSFILTATSVGTCTVQAEKAGTRNYFGETTTATIYWIEWNANYALQTVVENNAIALSAGNSFIVKTETVTASAFSSTGGSAITSAAVGTTIRINSTSFAGLSPADLSVTFRPYEDAVITAVTSTYVEVAIPSGSVTGVIAIDSPRGVAYTQSFTVSP